MVVSGRAQEGTRRSAPPHQLPRIMLSCVRFTLSDADIACSAARYGTPCRTQISSSRLINLRIRTRRYSLTQSASTTQNQLQHTRLQTRQQQHTLHRIWGSDPTKVSYIRADLRAPSGDDLRAPSGDRSCQRRQSCHRAPDILQAVNAGTLFPQISEVWGVVWGVSRAMRRPRRRARSCQVRGGWATRRVRRGSAGRRRCPPRCPAT